MNSKECFIRIMDSLDHIQSIFDDLQDISRKDYDSRLTRIRMNVAFLENELELIDIEECEDGKTNID
jgi:hypothetical protein